MLDAIYRNTNQNPTRSTVSLFGALLLSALALTGCNSGSSSSSDPASQQQSVDRIPEDATESGSDATEGFARVERNVPTLYLTLAPSDLQDLYTRDPESDERLAASYRFAEAEEETSLHSMRFRGSSSRHLPKKSFNIRFNEPQDLLYGSTRMNANAMYSDGSMMREHLSFGMFRRLGLPAPRTNYVDIVINENYEGLYIHVERVDEHLLADAGLNPNGTLVRDEFRYNQSVASAFGFALSELTVPEQHQLLSESFDSRGDPNWEAVAEVVRWVEKSAPGALFAEEFAERFNEQVFTDWLAIHYLVGDIDAYGNDYWLYLDHDDPQAQWHVIPWDKDLSFGSHHRNAFGVANDFFSYETPVTSYWSNRLIELYLETPELEARLKQRLAQLMADEFSPDYFEQEIAAAYDRIAPSLGIGPGDDAFVLHPRHHHSDQSVSQLHNETLIDYVHLRHGYLRNWISPNAGPTYQATLSISNEALSAPLVFTDSSGWTIGVLQPLETPTVPGEITLSVSQDSSVPWIDRVWSLHNTGSDFDAELTLFYRNNIPGAAGQDLQWDEADQNWYAEDLIAVGRQTELKLAEKFGNQYVFTGSGQVNPYSNKISSSRVRISYGENQYVATIP